MQIDINVLTIFISAVTAYQNMALKIPIEYSKVHFYHVGAKVYYLFDF